MMSVLRGPSATLMQRRGTTHAPPGRSIAGGIPVSLYDTLPGIDHRNASLVIKGHRPRNRTYAHTN
jgi:hypothetical protein